MSVSKSKVASFNIEVKTLETKHYKTKELETREYIIIDITKGATKWEILNFGFDGTFDVRRTVNGKASAIASRLGKVFHSWEDVCDNYKSISETLKENYYLVETYQSLITKTNK